MSTPAGSLGIGDVLAQGQADRRILERLCELLRTDETHLLRRVESLVARAGEAGVEV